MFPVLVIATLFASIQRSDSQAPRTIPELESRVREVLARTHTPGISIAIVAHDSVVLAAGIGLADVASGRGATRETLFRIGSTSKTFTALMILLLEQEGGLHLSDPISRYAPEIGFTNAWESTDPVRIVNLLEHTAGWDDWSMRVFGSSDTTPLTLRQGLDLDVDGRTSRWRPGTRVSYTNWGPPVAAYIIEKRTNQSFEQLVHDRLFVPIGMTTATYQRPSADVPTATLYHGDGKTPFRYWYVPGRPTGAINASATDMAAYLRFLINRGAVRGRQLLPRSSMVRLELPTTSLTARAGLPVGYGLFLSTYVAGGFVWVGHTGEVPGGLTTLAYRPDAGVGYAFTINSSNPAAESEINALIRGYLTADVSRPTPPPIASMSTLARSYSGWYVSDNPRMRRFYFVERLQGFVHVQAGDSALTLDPVLGGAQRFVPVSERLFRGPDEPVATLALVNDSADGRPASLEFASFGAPLSFGRISPVTVYLTVGLCAAFFIVTVVSLLRLSGWPFVSAVAVVVCLLIAKTSREDAFARFGHATLWSVGLLVGITVFAVASILGMAVAVRSRRSYAVAAGSINLIALAYLVWWGVLGWRIWA